MARPASLLDVAWHWDTLDGIARLVVHGPVIAARSVMSWSHSRNRTRFGSTVQN